MVQILRKGELVADIPVARSFLEKVRGLMFKKESEGLILDFGEEGKYSIWMLFMKFSLDLIFVAKNGEVVDIARDVPPVSFNSKTWKIYTPNKPCKWVIELPSGKKNIKVGDTLIFLWNS